MEKIPPNSTLEFEVMRPELKCGCILNIDCQVELLDFYPAGSDPTNRPRAEDEWSRKWANEMAHVRGPTPEEDPTAGFDKIALFVILLFVVVATMHSNGYIQHNEL